jgi:hypothetical protein
MATPISWTGDDISSVNVAFIGHFAKDGCPKWLSLVQKIHDKPKETGKGYAVQDTIRVFRNDRLKREGEAYDSAYNESLVSEAATLTQPTHRRWVMKYPLNCT